MVQPIGGGGTGGGGPQPISGSGGVDWLLGLIRATEEDIENTIKSDMAAHKNARQIASDVLYIITFVIQHKALPPQHLP
jgi:hypothetical protein